MCLARKAKVVKMYPNHKNEDKNIFVMVKVLNGESSTVIMVKS
jgi:hypothetical protein